MTHDPAAGLRALEEQALRSLSCSDTSDVGLLRLRMDADFILSVRETIRAVEEEARKMKLAKDGFYDLDD